MMIVNKLLELRIRKNITAFFLVWMLIFGISNCAKKETSTPVSPSPDVSTPSIIDENPFYPLLWSAFIESTSIHNIISKPLIDQNILVFRKTSPAENFAFLYGLDIDTGKTLWKEQLKQGGRGGVIWNGTLFFGGTHLYAYDVKSGKELWSIPSKYEISYSAPALSDSTLFVCKYLPNDYRRKYGSSESRIKDSMVAVDAKTGEILWEKSIEDGLVNAPAIGNGLVYFGTFDGHFYALEAETGIERWKIKNPDWRITATPAVDDENVYFVSWKDADDSVYALDAFNGKERWKFTPSSILKIDEDINMDNSTPVLSEGILYVSASPSYLGVVFAIQSKTGSMVWKSMPLDGSLEIPTIAHNKVYVGSLYALDIDTGEAYKVNIKTAAQTTITAYEDKVFIRDSYGAIHAIQKK
jgi:outer membrane protein assembly factor BamB